jgi:NADH-quinone oxidoreductase subunit J
VPDLLVFVAATAIIIGGALGVVLSKNPVHSALNLIATLIGIALAFIEQSANFLAAVQIIVYAGAIVILFLFVIMFLGVDYDDDLRVEPLAGQRLLAGVAVAILSGGLIALMAAGGWYSGASSVVARTDPTNDIGVLGRSVFTTYLFAFEATALLLIIAVVGAVHLARRTQRPAAQGSAVPPGGPAPLEAGDPGATGPRAADAVRGDG